MLACARLGAPHSVVFGGSSADALKSIQDADACGSANAVEAWTAARSGTTFSCGLA
jgi:acyl-coenzyme A synthetase/AMP-(fatty) acid ligase